MTVDVRAVRLWREEAIENLGRPKPTAPSAEHLRMLTDPRDRRIVALANWLLDADTIVCEGCGRTTTDPDKWDPEVETGRVLCDRCWEKEHPHG